MGRTPLRRSAAAIALTATALTGCAGGNTTNDTTDAAPVAPAPGTGPGPVPDGGLPDLGAARVRFEPVASGFESPTAIAFRPGDARPYVAEQGGTVRVVEDGRPAPTPVLSLAVSGGNEQGLLGLAFSADGDLLYVDYTDPAGDTHVAEYRMRGDVADPASRRELLFVDQPFANHNGGSLVLGPDGMLYVGLGDGGAGGDPQGNAQDLGVLLGKILRIDPRAAGRAPYSVPADNPFAGRDDARGEIWMYGLRNPWRFSFDRATGDVWIGDVGQGRAEEVDFAAAGEAGVNWGWDKREGTGPYDGGTRPDGARDPLIEITHDDGSCSVIGGYVYRGAAIPALAGAYLYGDFCDDAITAVTQRDGATVDRRAVASVGELTSFGEDADGELYAVSRRGTVSRLTTG